MAIKPAFSPNVPRPVMGRTFPGSIISPGQIIGGGSGSFSLPYLYDFDRDEHVVGQAPADWVDLGNGILPIVANSPQDSIAYNPSRKCVHLRNDVTNFCNIAMLLPYDGEVDITSGIRVMYWQKAEQINVHVNRFLAADLGILTPGDATQFNFTPYSEQNRVDLNVRNSGASLWTDSITGASGLDSSRWHSVRLQIEPNNDQWSVWIHEISSEALRFSAVDNAFPDGTWNPTVIKEIEYNNFNDNDGNQTALWMIGYWIGNISDSWPAIVMP